MRNAESQSKLIRLQTFNCFKIKSRIKWISDSKFILNQISKIAFKCKQFKHDSVIWTEMAFASESIN